MDPTTPSRNRPRTSLPRGLRRVRPGRGRLLQVVVTAFAIWAPLGCAQDHAPARNPPPDAASPPSQGPPPGEAYDWHIAGGRVVDGTGAPAREADLLLRDGRIAWIGPVDAERLVIDSTFDARGLVVTPGFIDPHAHGDPVESPDFHNFLAMGVTTIVLGQDGASPEAAGLAGHLERVERAAPRVNVAYLVGHNTLRLESGVGYGDPDPAALGRMAGLVDRAMEAGALGLSTGLEYDPGGRAGLEELVALARPVAARGGVVMSHMRNEDANRVEESLRELLDQGRGSGARVHVSHLKVVLGHDPGQADRILAALAEARAEGVSITADVYPYTASFTGVAILFPAWARPPNDYDAVVRTRRDELAAHLRARVESRNGPEATLFGSGPWRGRTLAEAAAATGRPFEDLLVELGPGGARAAYFVMDEEVMSRFLEDPHVAIASDGSPVIAHPRGYGTFPRVIQRWVVEDGRLSLEEAVRKMTGLSASVLGLDDAERVEPRRGRIQEGWAADLAAFDPAELLDTADYEAPHQLARGMRMVWVNGHPGWQDGSATPGPGRGQVVRAVSENPTSPVSAPRPPR